ncbi:hypothetical protein L0128_04160 [candidate division KSB1 bacterium]|nr:hypothetical protein [candidate division KSB1 bacterium]
MEHTITLPDTNWSELEAKANRLGVTTEELVRIGIDDLLSRPDESLQLVVQDLCKKDNQFFQQLA